MYVPKAFREERVEVLHELMRREGFATLVTFGRGGIAATHLPLVLDAHPAPMGTLRAHVARANPQWQSFDPTVPALAVFEGPHHYVSPSWYPAMREHGRVVPTWDYVTVHAYGTLRAVEDRAWLRAHLESLVAREEARFERPWRIADAPDDYVEAMLGAIVGFEMTVSRLDGSWKLSQNHDAADRAGVIAGLRALGAGEMADLVAGAERELSS